MKKFLLSLLLGAAVMPAFADEPAKTTFGYCNDTFIYVGDGLTTDTDKNIGLAIRIPASSLQSYKGGRIIGFEFAAADGSNEHEVNAFLRKGSLTGDNVASTTEYVSFDLFGGYMGKVNERLFDKGWTIPEDLDEDMYLGLFTHQPANKHIIGTSANMMTPTANTVFLADTDDLSVTEPENWEDVSKIPGLQNTNPVLRAIIELPSDNYTGVLKIVDALMPNICPVGVPSTAYLFLKNDGTTPISSFEVTFALGEESTSQNITIQGDPMPLGYETSNRGPIKVPVNVLGTGKHVISITKVNGEENKALEKDSKFELDIVGVPTLEAQKHIRRPLYEYYTSESNHKGGVQEEDIVRPSVLAFKGRCTYLPHHASDKFSQNPISTPAYIGGEQTTIELSDADRWAIKMSSDNINRVNLPCASIDRTVKLQLIELGGKNTLENPVYLGTPYPEANAYLMPEALNTPTFASVELDNQFNKETSIATIKVSGTIADLLPEGEKAKLSLFIVEEGVVSESQEFPDSEEMAEKYPDGKFTHHRVIRETVTDFWGEELEPGKDFVKTFTVELDNPTWDVDHMKVVAVIQRPETNHFLKMDVLNTAEEQLTDTYSEYVQTGISEIELSSPASTSLYDLQGRKLTAPVRGINIINGKKVLF